MGKLSNGADGVTLNEVTVSFRATKNSPHDALTWDPHGIRGVTMDGGHWYTNGVQVVRSVNLTVGGVSFECDETMLDVLADKEARESLVTRSLAAQAEKERQEASKHDWVEREEKRTEHAQAWQCSRCGGWVVGPKELDRPEVGCLGRLPTDQEKRQQDVKAAIQEFGRTLQAIHERAVVCLRRGMDPEKVLTLGTQLLLASDIEPAAEQPAKAN